MQNFNMYPRRSLLLFIYFILERQKKIFASTPGVWDYHPLKPTFPNSKSVFGTEKYPYFKVTLDSQPVCRASKAL